MASDRCPKCNYYVELNSTECSKCGLVFEQYEEYLQKQQAMDNAYSKLVLDNFSAGNIL